MLNEILRFIIKDVAINPNDAKSSDFIAEIEDCLDFFDKSKPFGYKKTQFSSVHANKITLGIENIKEKKYFLRRDVLYAPELPPHREIFSVNGKRVIKHRQSYMDGKTIGSGNGEVVSKKELEEVLSLVHNITITYSEHIKSNKR